MSLLTWDIAARINRRVLVHVDKSVEAEPSEPLPGVKMPGGIERASVI
jgi:hypothetical protein